jgi:hypothetical protein
VRRSRIENNEHEAIVIQSGGPMEFRDSVFAGNGGMGIVTGRGDLRIVGNRFCMSEAAAISSSSSHISVEHNTFYGNAYALQGTGSGTVTLTSNIFVGQTVAAIAPGGLVISDGYNLYYENAMDGVDGFVPSSDSFLTLNPELTGTDECLLALSVTSPARGSAADGSDLGAP